MKDSQIPLEWTNVGFDCLLRHVGESRPAGAAEAGGPVVLRANEAGEDSWRLEIFCDRPACVCGASAGF